MALSFGWRANDQRESIWKDDPALVGVTAAALDAWREDGDASWLRPFATNGQPSVITFRTLTPDESRIAQAYMFGDGSALEAWTRATLACFRMACDFPDAPTEIMTPEDQARHSRVAKDHGVRMLAPEFVADIEARYPGMVSFYGALIYRATHPQDAEKKASSPPPTLKPSSVEASTTAITEPSPAAGAA